jgi:hypothetical protein
MTVSTAWVNGSGVPSDRAKNQVVNITQPPTQGIPGNTARVREQGKILKQC